MINPKLRLGLERFFEEGIYHDYKRARIALLTHQAALDENLRLSFELFYHYFGERLSLLFSPQHGLFSEKQANMIPSFDEREPLFGLKVKSLYGPRLSPDLEDLQEIDALFVDLVDVGCRVYTYIWTLYLLMETCEKLDKEVVILDRPNPLGNYLEGPVLESSYFSFVGLTSLPMRHGLTLGEIALLFKKRHFPRLNLRIIPLKNYSPKELYPYFQRPWILPSPNLPTFECALVYPGMVLLEGTNLSEGRGTTLPFLIFGAPFLRLKPLKELFEEAFPAKEWGLKLRPLAFEPTFDKWKGKRCFGFQIHILDPKCFNPVRFALKLLKIIKDTHEEFDFLPPPYEFEREKKPIEILLGNRALLAWLLKDQDIVLEEELNKNLELFKEENKSIRLYSSPQHLA